MDRKFADITIGGKLLAGGLAPLCAVIVSGSLIREFQEAKSAPILRLTFSGNSLTCAVGETVQLIAAELDLWQNVSARGTLLDEMLRHLLKDTDVMFRGIGLLRAVAWPVKNGKGRRDSAAFRQLAERRRVLAMPGYREGAKSDSVFTTITPALDSTDDDLALISEQLAAVIKLHLRR
jgi:adenosylmethionine-8-amino-7-oxononanoate aminotransferase